MKDIAWLAHTGKELTDDEWNSGCVDAIGIRLYGESIDEVDNQGQPISGDTLLILLSNQPDAIAFSMPRHKPSERWVPVFDTSRETTADEVYAVDDTYLLDGRSVAVLVLQGGWRGHAQATPFQPCRSTQSSLHWMTTARAFIEAASASAG